MTVGRDYMLEKPPPPPPWKVYLDLTILPALIDVAGGLEAVLERASVQGRTRPARAVGVAVGVGYALGWLTRRRWPKFSSKWV